MQQHVRHEVRMSITRRKLLLCAAGLGLLRHRRPAARERDPAGMALLDELGYGDVVVNGALQRAQLLNTHEVLMQLSEDSLLRPFRQMAAQKAPGADLGGWYTY